MYSPLVISRDRPTAPSGRAARKRSEMKFSMFDFSYVCIVCTDFVSILGRAGRSRGHVTSVRQYDMTLANYHLYHLPADIVYGNRTYKAIFHTRQTNRRATLGRYHAGARQLPFFFFCLTASPAGRRPILSCSFSLFTLRAVYCDCYLCQRAAIADSDVPPPSDVPSLLTRPPPSNMSPSFRLLAQRHGRARRWSRGRSTRRGAVPVKVSVIFDTSRELLGPPLAWERTTKRPAYYQEA